MQLRRAATTVVLVACCGSAVIGAAPAAFAAVRSVPAAGTPSCPGGTRSVKLDMGWSGLSGKSLKPGGGPIYTYVTITNTTPTDLENFQTSLVLKAQPGLKGGRPVAFSWEQEHTMDGWHNVFLQQEADGTQRAQLADVSSIQSGQSVTLDVMVDVTTEAQPGDYTATLSGSVTDNGSVQPSPLPSSNVCTRVWGAVASAFTVPGATTAPSGGASASAAPSATATAVGQSPTATTSSAPAAPASPSAAGGGLAETGASSSVLPLSAGGALLAVLGAGLFAARRRKGRHI